MTLESRLVVQLPPIHAGPAVARKRLFFNLFRLILLQFIRSLSPEWCVLIESFLKPVFSFSAALPNLPRGRGG